MQQNSLRESQDRLQKGAHLPAMYLGTPGIGVNTLGVYRRSTFCCDMRTSMRRRTGYM